MELFVVLVAGPVLIRAGIARAHVIDEEYDDVGLHVSPLVTGFQVISQATFLGLLWASPLGSLSQRSAWRRCMAALSASGVPMR